MIELEYILGGKTIKVPEDKVDDFLSKYPEAKIKKAIGFDLLDPNFQEDTVESADAVSEETPAQGDTVSVSEDTSSELQEYNEETRLNEDDLSLISSEISDVSFEPVKVTKFVPGSVGRTGGNPYVYRMEQPYEEELNQARLNLKNEKEVTEEDVFNEARLIISENKKHDLRVQKNKNYLKNLTDKERVDLGFETSKLKNKNERDIEDEGNAIEFFSKQYEKSAELKNLKNFKKSFEDPNFEFDLSYAIDNNEKIVELQDGRKVPLAAIEAYEGLIIKNKESVDFISKSVNNYIDKMEKQSNLITDIDFLKRNYSKIDKLAAIANQNIFESAAGIYGSFIDFTDLISADSTDEKAPQKKILNEVLKKSREYLREEYSHSVDYENAFDSFDNFGEFTSESLAGQTGTLMMLATGQVAGLTGLGLSSYGRTISDIEILDEEQKTSTSNLEKRLTALGYSTFEVTLGSIPTIKLLGKTAGRISASKSRDLYKGFADYAKKNYKGIPEAFVTEYVSEGATQFFQNGIDVIRGVKNTNQIFEGVDEAAMTGGMLGVAISSAPIIKGATLAAFSDYKKYEDFRNNAAKIAELNKQISGLDKRTKEYKTITSVIKDLTTANSDILNELENNIETELSPDGYNLFKNATEQQENIRTEIDKISKRKDLKNSTKQARISILKQKFDQLAANRNVFKKDFKNIFSIESKDVVDDYTNKAKQELGVGANIDDINKLAQNMYSMDKIEDRNNKAKKAINKLAKRNIINTYTFEKENKDLLITLKEDLKVGVENGSIDITNKKQQEIIKNIENGSLNGVNIPIISKDGSIKYKIYVSGENSLKNGKTETAIHEIGHSIFTEALGSDPELFNGLAISILDYLKKNNKSALNRIVYQTAGQNVDEILTNFLEEVSSGRLDLEAKNNKQFTTTIGLSLRNIFSKATKSKDLVTFKGSNDISDFLKVLGRKLSKGELSVGDIDLIKEKGLPGAEVKIDSDKKATAKESLSSLQEQLDNLDEVDFDFDMFAFEAAKANLEKKIELAKKKEAEPKKEAKDKPKKKVNEKLIGDQFKEMVPEKTTNAEYKSKIAPKVIRKIEDDRMLFPLVKKIAAGYNIVADNVYGKSWDDFYDAVIGVQLKKNILNFKPETNDDLGGYIVGGQAGVRNRVKEALEKFKKEESKATEDISQAADLTAEEKTSKQEVRKKYTSIINSNVVPSFTTKAITEKLTGIINSLKSKITDKAGNNAASTPLIKEIKSKVGKVVGDKTAIPKLIRERMGKFTKDQKTYEQFLIKNKKAILENMTTTWLMTAIPNAVEKSVGGKYTGEFDVVNIAGQEAKYEVFKPNYVPYSEWKGAKIDREGGAKRGITSGNELTRRVPANRISDQDFVDALIIKGNNKKTQSKFESLSKALAEELSFEIISRELKNPNSGITQAFKENQNALGVMLVDNFVEEYNRQSERGLVKFSVSMRTGINKIDSARSGLNTLLRIKYPEYTPLNPLTFDEIEKIVEKDIDLKLMYLDLKKAHEEYISRAIGEGKGLTGRQQKDFEKFKKGGNDVFSSWINTSLQYSYFNINNVLGTNPLYTNRFKIADTTRRKSEIFLEKYIKDLIKLNSKTAAEEFIRTVQAPLASGKGQSLFGNNEGIFSFIKNKMKKDTSIDKAFKNVGLVKSGGGKTFTIDGKKVTTELDYTTQAKDLLELFNGKNKKVSDLKFIEKRKEESKQSAKRFIKFIEYLREEKVDKDVVGLMLNSMAGSMRSIAKMSSEIKGAFIVEDLKPKDYTYEHGIPTKQLLIASASYIVSGEKVTKDVLKNIVNKGSIYIIPTKIAKAIDAFYRSTFSNNKALTESDPEIYRYFEVSDNFKNYLESQGILDFNQNNTTYFSSDKNNVKINTKFSKSNIELNKVQKGQQAIDNAVKYSYAQNPKGISVWDFDDTLARTKSNVLYTMPDGTKGKLDAAQFAAKSEELADQGAKFDFSEFSKVMKGEKGPMFDKAIKRNKKFGNKNVYILTARPADSKYAIHDFLKGIGLDVRLENIVGLADGNPQAKANWMIGKVAEGYNDFYFADDHLGNVKAVKEVLDNFDVKGKVQQAKVKFSMSLDKDFNDMIERNKGISSTKEFSPVVAKRMAKNKGMFKFWMPASLDDFRGLTQYVFAGKGKQGEADQKFFQDALITPYFRGIKAIEDSRQTFKEDFKALNRAYKPVLKKLGKLIPNGDYTYDQAIRVALWKKSGYDIPGLSKKDEKNLVDFVDSQADLTEYVLLLQRISKRPKWAKPEAFWDSQTILSDLNNMTEKGGRKEYISEFIENVDIIFSEKNLLKIKALYGEAQVSALKDIIWRMKNGTNRTSGKNKNVNRFNNWVNNSIGAIMFFNRRSALLQTLSTVNFINWSDNNIIKAGAAFANQPQFWKDFAMIFNSAKLKQRRAGLKSDVNEAEIASAVKGSKNKANAALSYLLKKGFLPTQMVDSFAIASGGATFYRNRVNTYLKQGMELAAAEKQAFEDFSQISEETQQSGDPALISSDQASALGRLLLAFQNTPIQLNRSIKKAALDIKNRRKSPGQTMIQSDFSNLSKIIYYGAIQNIIFSALQNALFALIPGFGDDDDELTEEEQKEKYGKVVSTKQGRIINGISDTLLKGGFGVPGAFISTAKNMYMEYNKQEKKKFLADHTYTILAGANLAPPVGSKLRKIYSAIQTNRFEKDVIKERGWDVTIDGRFNLSPSYRVLGSFTEGATNFPLDRMVSEVDAVTEALDSRNTTWQRLALAMGWKTWDVSAKNEEHDLIKIKAKSVRKKEGIEKAKKTRAGNKLTKEERSRISVLFRYLPDSEKRKVRKMSKKKKDDYFYNLIRNK